MIIFYIMLYLYACFDFLSINAVTFFFEKKINLYINMLPYMKISKGKSWNGA